MVTQTRVCDEGRRDFTKHMLRLCHETQTNDGEANEIIMLNSHDGTSSYQMLAGMFRFVCSNGLVCGDTVADVRVKHKGQIVDNVVKDALDVLDGFGLVREVIKAIELKKTNVFQKAAFLLKYKRDKTKSAPITGSQILTPRRVAENGADL